MNIQLTGNATTTRPSKTARRQAEAVSSRVAVAAAGPIFTAEEEHKILVTGVFSVLIGWIIINSGWPAHQMGVPLMLLGLLLPLLPVIAQYRTSRHGHRTQLAIAKLEAEGKGRTGRGLVYELNSQDYTPAR